MKLPRNHIAKFVLIVALICVMLAVHWNSVLFGMWGFSLLFISAFIESESVWDLVGKDGEKK